MDDFSNDPPAVKPSMPAGEGKDGARRRRPVTYLFDRFASLATRWAGSPYAFGCAVLAIVLWLVLGPVFHYSDAWQLIVNTGTTIVTFLMVFLLQQSQNKDSVAMHLKLDELLSSQRAANNALIGIENASEEELQQLAAAYLRLASREQLDEADGDAAAKAAQLARNCGGREVPEDRDGPRGNDDNDSENDAARHAGP